tara:strand:+ start:381 stop:563 length:183 start_codon:yes stop_codon:yes gene_type:complete
MNETEKQIKEASENRRYDPQKHLETLLAIRDAVWIEGEEDGITRRQGVDSRSAKKSTTTS